MIPHSNYNVDQQPKRWSRVSWWYSSILAVALVLLFATLIVSAFGGGDDFTGVVRDAYTGKPVSGAQVSAAGTAVTTNGSGQFSFTTPLEGDLSVQREDYESTQITVTPGMQQFQIELRPTTLSGQVVNIQTGDPVEGATVVAAGPDSVSVTSITDSDGRYLLVDVPGNATVTVMSENLSEVSKPVGQNVVLDFEVRPDLVTGMIVDQDGTPVAGATVQIGTATTTSADDGTYRLKGVPESGQIVVKKAGYREVISEFPTDLVFDATIERFVVRAIYSTALTAANEEAWNDLLRIADETEVNAIVLDVKDNNGLVRYDTNVAMAEEIGAEDIRFDLSTKIQQLHDHGLYAIARIVVFEDPVLALARPDLAIHDKSTGELWTTWNGQAWVNAHEREVWQYNTDIATEVAKAGFDEIQLDYIRFPTDGLLENADFSSFADETRVEAIAGFLTGVQESLAPTGAYLAVDIFGFTLWDEGDGGIGQNLEVIEPIVDVINPMIYPSHFAEGEMGFDYPNDHPYEVILWSLESGETRIGEQAYKFRPWLQDFSYGPGIEYGPAEIEAQIKASEEFGAPGWMLWNAANVYSESALKPE